MSPLDWAICALLFAAPRCLRPRLPLRKRCTLPTIKTVNPLGPLPMPASPARPEARHVGGSRSSSRTALVEIKSGCVAAKATPDGHTLLATPPGPLAINQSFFPARLRPERPSRFRFASLFYVVVANPFRLDAAGAIAYAGKPEQDQFRFGRYRRRTAPDRRC
jgi:hypothetical protein